MILFLNTNSIYYQFEPYHKAKEILIDSTKCQIEKEIDYFIRPVTSHVFQYLSFIYPYDQGMPTKNNKWELKYGISFIQPFHYISAHGIPQPEGWFELNVDSLFVEGQPYTNDKLFGRYISRYRQRSKELNLHQADSILQSWGFEGFNENAFQ